MKAASTTINYTSDVTGILSAKRTPTLVLDQDYLILEYGENKQTFKPSENAYLKLYPAYSEFPYTIMTSEGVCTKKNTDSLFTYTDKIAFINKASATLSYKPHGSVTTEWIAGAGGTVLINEKILTTSEKVIGILKCTYSIKFDRLQLVAPVTFTDEKIIVVAHYDDETKVGSTSISVNYLDSTTISKVNVELTIKDISDDKIIPGASVTVSLSNVVLFTGISNEKGTVTIPLLTKGVTYDLKVTVTNFINSDLDYLNNDSFTVPGN